MSSLTLKQLKNPRRDGTSKKICFLGLGIENYALLKFLLKKKVKAEFTVCDFRKKIQNQYKLPKKIKLRLGEDYDHDLGYFDVVFRIAGYPLFSDEIYKAEELKTIITSPTKFFFDLCPTKNIIGVTGTKGKGTASSLIYEILKADGRKVYFGGNIGYPMFGFLEKLKKDDWVVLELSSFQLEDLHKSPHISIITNFTKEHLAPADPNNPNYHHSLVDYWAAKTNIFRYQGKKDYLIVNPKLEPYLNKIIFRTKILFFEKSNLESKLIGEHNKENIGAAVQVAKILRVKNSVIEKAVRDFDGLEHRDEFVRELDGVRYYDSSFATTPETSIIDMKSFSQPIILIAGGADKGSNFSALAREIKKRVKFLVLIDGEGSQKVRKALNNIHYSKKKMTLAYDMEQAVKIAHSQAKSGDVVLLSPGCASFGVFKNYKQRGDLFTKEVNKLSRGRRQTPDLP